METKGALVDQKELATQLRKRGLVSTIANLEYRFLYGDTSELLETLVAILNATDAPPIDLHIEEGLAVIEGPRYFFVQHVLCDLKPLLNVLRQEKGHSYQGQ